MAGSPQANTEKARSLAYQPFLTTLERQGRTVTWVARELSATTGRHVEPRALWNYLHGRRRMPEYLLGPLRYVLSIPVDLAPVDLPRDKMIRTPTAPKPPKVKRPLGRPRKHSLPSEGGRDAPQHVAARGPPAA